VERTHKNLGLPTVFAKLVDLADMGLFLIADRGKGKTTILDVIRKELRHRDIMTVSIITYAGINKMAENMSDRSITMINRDFSSFYTDYLKDVAVNLIAQLITEHSVMASTGKYEIKIDNCTISFLSATQPKMIERLNGLPTWESMYKDRFFRLPLLYPLGTPKYQKEPPEVSSVLVSNSPISLPNSLRGSPTYERMLAIIERQTSEGRCRQHLDALLKSSAALNGRDVVLPCDIEFLQLYAGNLILDYLLSERERGVSNPLVFNSNSYLIVFYLLEHNGASKADLREAYKVSQVTITRNLNPLMAGNIVKGTYGKDWYVVNKDWIERYITPVRKFYAELGIW